MAAIFCLFSVTLCKLAGQDLSESTTNLAPNYNSNDNGGSVLSLTSPQIITVPRVYISPCPDSFRYTFNGKEWFGFLALPSLQRRRPLRIKILFSVGIKLISVSFTGVFK